MVIRDGQLLNERLSLIDSLIQLVSITCACLPYTSNKILTRRPDDDFDEYELLLFPLLDDAVEEEEEEAGAVFFKAANAPNMMFYKIE